MTFGPNQSCILCSRIVDDVGRWIALAHRLARLPGSDRPAVVNALPLKLDALLFTMYSNSFVFDHCLAIIERK